VIGIGGVDTEAPHKVTPATKNNSRSSSTVKLDPTVEHTKLHHIHVRVLQRKEDYVKQPAREATYKGTEY
jgi:hypothetical protein